MQQDFTFVSLLGSDGARATLSCTENRRLLLASSMSPACGGDSPTVSFDMTVSLPLNGSSQGLLGGSGGNVAAAVFRRYQDWQTSNGAAASVVCGPADASEVKVVATQVLFPALLYAVDTS